MKARVTKRKSRKITLNPDALPDLYAALKALLKAEWMVTHDWGGNRDEIKVQAKAALRKATKGSRAPKIEVIRPDGQKYPTRSAAEILANTLRLIKRCASCSHAAHSPGNCPDETYNGYSCRCSK